MKAYSAILPSGETTHYVDRKRYAWLLSLVFPLQPFIGIALHARTGHEGWLFIGLFLTYGLGTLLDSLLGEDLNNPPDAVARQLDSDPYYRYLTWAMVPVHLFTLVGCVVYATMAGLSVPGFAGLAVMAGISAGLAINTGHELGHKNSRVEKLLARLVLAIPAYGHFSLDHNRGHHRDVATFEDPASARMGETVYRFALREIPGAFRRAWQFEAERLEARGWNRWHPRNRLFAAWGLSAGLGAVLVLATGWAAIPFLLLHHAAAYFQLTTANYIEHYGLLRRRDAAGRLERCRPWHSWNSNHLLSNLALLHLERHSDHHLNPLRRYQSLRHLEDVPRLPAGYFGMYLLAYVPFLWFRVMDPRLLGLPQIDGRLARVNVAPAARARLEARYGAGSAGA